MPVKLQRDHHHFLMVVELLFCLQNILLMRKSGRQPLRFLLFLRLPQLQQLLEYLESHGAHLILPPKNDRQPYLHAGEMLIWPDTANNNVVVTMPDGSLLAGNPDEVEAFVGALLAAVSRLRKS